MKSIYLTLLFFCFHSILLAQCEISILELSNEACFDNNTPSDPIDDTFNVFINASVENGSSQFTITFNGAVFGPFDYGTGGSISNLPANSNLLSLNIVDYDDPNCFAQVEVQSSSCSDACLLIIDDYSVGACDDGGTPTDLTDDTFNLEMLVTGLNTGPTFSVTDGTTVFGPFNYNEFIIINNLPADDNPIVFTAYDDSFPDCNEVFAESQASCSEPCNLSIISSDLSCDENGTPNDGSDDFIYIDLVVDIIFPMSNNYFVEWSGTIFGPFPYGANAQVGPIPPSFQTELLNIYDESIPNCSTSFTFDGSFICQDFCQIAAAFTQNICNDNGTPVDPADDTYTIEVVATGNNLGTAFTVTETNSGLSWTLDYFSGGEVGPFPADGLTLEFTVSDIDNPDCIYQETFNPFACEPGACFINIEYIFALCDISDNTLFFNASNINAGTGYILTDQLGFTYGPFNYGEEIAVSGFPFDGGAYSFFFMDTDDPTCFEQVDVLIESCIAGELTITSNSINDIVCSDDCDGAIDITVSGGTPPYFYSWANGMAFEDISGLCAGTYSVTVTDNTGQTTSGNFTINQSIAPIEVVSIETIACSPNCSVIDLDIIGGSPPYSLELNGVNYASTTTIEGLNPGNYDVIVITDSNGCFLVAGNITIEACPETEITINNLSCNGDGSASITVLDGSPATFEWSNGETSAEISDLAAGIYSVTTTFEDCTSIGEVEILPVLDIAINSTFTDCELGTGSAFIQLNNPITDPIVEWSNGAIGESVSNLEAGGYSVTVTDPETDCSTHDNVIIQEDPSCFVTISGNVYNDDLLEACQVNGSVSGIPNIMLQLNTGEIAFSNPNGYFEFQVNPGTYTISINLTTSQYESVCTDPVEIVIPNWGDVSDNNNFFLKYGPYSDLEVKVVKGNARPGIQQFVRVCAMNHGAAPINGTVIMNHDPLQTFQSANPVETSYDDMNNQIVWNFTNLPPGGIFVYHAYLILPEDTPLGTLLNFNFEILPVQDDLTPEDNYLVCDQIVTGSYDPNDKAVSPKGIGPLGLIEPEETLLHYNIRFQNTGTDTAFTVVIRDTIDANLNLSSINLLPSDHPYSMSAEGNILEFTFNDILLPDSTTNEPESHGFVMFNIHLKEALEPGTQIRNRAGIYFDFNEPIITNTTLNTVAFPDFVATPENENLILDINPNPGNGLSILSLDLKDKQNLNVDIYDVNGKHVKSLLHDQTLLQGNHSFEIEQLEQGVYFIHVQTKNGAIKVLKFLAF